ncbi:MAG: hypothetical protein RJB01_780 [Actinomycetota bacterium]|jgi:hypothetical protein
MKRMILTASALAALTVGALSAPAHAYDRKAYTYAAGHMISAKDVPSPISLRSNGYFNAGSDGTKSWLCSKDDKDVEYSGGKYRFSINYQGKKKGASGINSSVQQYASATKAIAAFDELKKGAKTCSGATSGSSSYTNDAGDTITDTWSSLNTTGSVPMVTITGVASIFINTNYEDVSSDQDSPYTSDNYTVYTLLDDVIISTNYYSGSEINLSAAEKKAVNMAAFNAVDAWLG